MNILDKIVAHKKEEVAHRKKTAPLEQLRDDAFFYRCGLSMHASLLDANKTGIIAEFKRQSPSKGIINATADVATVTAAYTANGASALSVLTDTHFFGGSTANLITARANAIPIIRKDFMVDVYQLTEAKAMGADAILLIAACLSPLQVQDMAGAAQELGLEVLLEIHNEAELEHICPTVNMVGVNNRDLKSFSVDIQQSVLLAPQIPVDKVKITESGISDVQTIVQLKQHGYKGFLIGENFMKAQDPAMAFAQFVNQLKTAG